MPKTKVTATVAKIATAAGTGTVTGPRPTGGAAARAGWSPARGNDERALVAARPDGQPDAVHEEHQPQVEGGSDGRRQHGDNRESVRMCLHRGRHHVQLGEEARRERDSGLRDEQHGEREGERRLAASEAAIRVEVVIAVATAADDRDHREAPEDQQRVHEDVVDGPGDPLARRSRKADEDEPGVVD